MGKCERQMLLYFEFPCDRDTHFYGCKNLQPYVNKSVNGVIKKVEYLDIKGSAQQGFDCMILPDVCDVYLRARKAEH